MNAIGKWLIQFLEQTNDDVRRLQMDTLQSGQRRELVVEPLAVCVVASVALTLQYYRGHTGFGAWVRGLLIPWFGAWLTASENAEIVRLSISVLGDLAVYLGLPLLTTWFICKRNASEYGLELRRFFRGWPIYLGMYLVMIGPIIIMSMRPSFQLTYPFYHLRQDENLWPRFILWELLYAAQFVGLEFFFRGFMLHGCKRTMGMYAILAMTIPYCMIHFGKPIPESLAAIIAGIVLGFMSLKTGTIWLGAALHIAVAWTMDAAALWMRG